MKTAKIITTVFAITALACSAWAQGSLTPPGAPAPTMKTLDQVEPRTPISSVPYTISEPGSYYLTTNLTSTGHGVVITTDGVTLDLMGFTLSGDGGNNDYGVFVDGATNRVVEAVVVRNGAVKNFGDGIRAEYSMGGRFEQLAVSGNTYYGVHLYGWSGQCDGNTVADCAVSGNGTYGIYLYGQYGQCDGNTVADCTISETGIGIMLSGRYGECDGNTVADCTISGNDDVGVDLYGIHGQCNGNTVADCTISGNGNFSVNLYGNSGQCNGNTITDCTISGNGYYGAALSGQYGQCNGNTITDCTISGNGTYGVRLYGRYGECDGNTITDCTISENGDFGVYLYGWVGQCDGNTIADCTIRKNTNRGISLDYADGNRVEGNHVTGQTGNSTTYGIYCASTADNLIIRNSCVGQTNNFMFGSNDTYGPIVTASGALPTTGAGAHPLANFSF